MANTGRRLLLVLLLNPLATAADGDRGDTASTPRYVRIGHYQCVCQQGDFEANLKKVVAGLELASAAKLDIVSFPESFLTGYFRGEDTARANSFAVDSPQMQRVLEQTVRFEPLFMVGFNELRDDGRCTTRLPSSSEGKCWDATARRCRFSATSYRDESSLSSRKGASSLAS